MREVYPEEPHHEFAMNSRDRSRHRCFTAQYGHAIMTIISGGRCSTMTVGHREKGSIMTQPMPQPPQPESDRPEPAASDNPFTPPWQAAPSRQTTEPRQTAPSRRDSPSGVQVLLLTLGVVLITAAVLTFASVAYTTLGDMGRAACIGVVGLAGLAVAAWLAGRLRVTAEGIAWAGLAALTVDAFLIGDLPLGWPDELGDTVTGAVLFGLGCVTIVLRAVHQKGRQPLCAWSLYAAFALSVSLMLLCDLPVLPRYMSEAVSVAVFTMLAGAACLIGPADSVTHTAGPEPVAGMERAQRAAEAQQTVNLTPAAAPEPATDSQQSVASPSPVASPPLAASPQAPTSISSPVPQRMPAPEQYGAERIIVAFISALSLTVIAIADFSNRMVEKNLVAIAAYVLLLALTATAWLRTCHPMDGGATRTLRWIFGTAALISATGMFLGDPKPMPGDAIVAMFGIMALSIGVRWMFVRPTMRSWTALWPGLSLTLVPPLLMTWSGHAATVRVVLLFAAALAVLLVGSFMEWQAPVVMGSIVLALHVVVQAWPWITIISRDFWWIWLLVGGIILIAAAAHYEASLKSVQSLGKRISQLR